MGASLTGRHTTSRVSIAVSGQLVREVLIQVVSEPQRPGRMRAGSSWFRGSPQCPSTNPLKQGPGRAWTLRTLIFNFIFSLPRASIVIFFFLISKLISETRTSDFIYIKFYEEKRGSQIRIICQFAYFTKGRVKVCCLLFCAPVNSESGSWSILYPVPSPPVWSPRAAPPDGAGWSRASPWDPAWGQPLSQMWGLTQPGLWDPGGTGDGGLRPPPHVLSLTPTKSQLPKSVGAFTRSFIRSFRAGRFCAGLRSRPRIRA